MAWTAPRTWVTGETVTAALLNTYVRDNQLNIVGLIGSSATVIGAPAGSAAAPAFSFAGDPDSGGYNIGVDQLGWATGGTLRLSLSTTALTSTLPILSPDGTVSAPGQAFSADTNTGVYRVTTDTIAITTAGTQRVFVGPTGKVGIGTASPTYKMHVEDTAAVTAGTDAALLGRLILSAADTGAKIGIYGRVNPGGLTSGTLAGQYAVYGQADTPGAGGTVTTSVGVYGAVQGATGTVTNARAVWAGNGGSGGTITNKVGIHIDNLTGATNSWGLYSLHTGYHYIAGSLGIGVTVPLAPLHVAGVILSGDGSASAPGQAFASDTNTGILRVGTDQVGIATNGTLRFDISTTAVTTTLPILLAAGSAAAPAMSYSGDTNSGSYSAGADYLGWAAGGAQKLGLDATATAGNTALLLWDVDNATLERVTVGAADSGGVGYKVLRIPN